MSKGQYIYNLYDMNVFFFLLKVDSEFVLITWEFRKAIIVSI